MKGSSLSVLALTKDPTICDSIVAYGLGFKFRV